MNLLDHYMRIYILELKSLAIFNIFFFFLKKYVLKYHVISLKVFFIQRISTRFYYVRFIRS